MQTLRLDQKVITNEISLNRNIYTSSSLASVRPLAQLLDSFYTKEDMIRLCCFCKLFCAEGGTLVFAQDFEYFEITGDSSSGCLK